ncbi:SDR family oxidoreductase [Amaricoccus macauensis]|uniref:SDR family oxidoreductase n=1 Tax=Amaricoccus macauensis TaxID=57001 RepID=UPI003C7E5121
MSEIRSMSGRRVLIAGASSGMGRETAKAAAREGAELVLLARDEARLAAIGDECSQLGAGKVLTIQADASNAKALEAAISSNMEVLEAVDTLVNTIGMNIVRRAFSELTAESWASMIDVNLNAAFNLSKAVLPIMRRRGGGLIVNVSSTAAKKPDPSGAAYQATKAGVAAMTHAIMEEEWGNGIRATAILPGMTDTPLLEKRPSPPTPEMRAKALKPEDVAEACMFVMRLPARAHVSEIVIQPAIR